MRFAFASLAVAALGLGCSSGDISVAQADAGADAARDDAAPGPCVEELGVAKFCVDVGLIAPRPNYDGASLAGPLGIDGKGVLYVYLYDKDPSPATGDPARPGAPIATLRLPDPSKVGAEIALDKDVPTTLSGTAAPGTYWAVAVFQDNKTTTRPVDNGGLLPGDFLQVPTITGRKADYPKLVLEEGKVAKLGVTLRPYRQVVANLSTPTVSEVHVKATANKTVHGDGPMIFLLYAGSVNVLDSSVQPLGISQVPCVALKPAEIAPPTPQVPFGTWAEGGLQVVGALVDYPGSSFPTPGMITSDMSKPPVVQISPSVWSTTVSLPMTTLLNPYAATSTVADPYVCP